MRADAPYEARNHCINLLEELLLIQEVLYVDQLFANSKIKLIIIWLELVKI